MNMDCVCFSFSISFGLDLTPCTSPKLPILHFGPTTLIHKIHSTRE